MKSDQSTGNVEITAKEPAMDDGALAAGLMDQVIGGRGVREPVKSMLERAYSLLSRVNSAWTRRRVRAVFNREANRIEHREIAEMRAVVEARKRHAAYREETTNLASLALVRAKTRHSDLAPR